MFQSLLSPQAIASIEDIYFRGFVEFGQRIAEEYDILIRQAIEDLCENPMRIGSRQVAGKDDGLYQYPLVYSKRKAGVNIKNPKHVVLYYVFDERGLIVIADVLRVGREKARDEIDRKDIIKRMRFDS